MHRFINSLHFLMIMLHKQFRVNQVFFSLFAKYSADEIAKAFIVNCNSNLVSLLIAGHNKKVT